MSNDKHFAELAMNLKQHNGFIHWGVIALWYDKHYITVSTTESHRYSHVILELLSRYVTTYGLMSVSDLIDKVSPRFVEMTPKFTDLSDDYNNKLDYRILAAICGTLILTRKDKIPHYDEL